MSVSTLTRMKTSRYSLLSAPRYLLGDNADIYLRLWLRRVVMREESDQWVTPGGYTLVTGHTRAIPHNAVVITHCIGYWTWPGLMIMLTVHSSRH